MSNQRVVYGQGAQVLRSIAMDVMGAAVVPTSATYTIVDRRYGDTDAAYIVVSSTAATLDAVSTTLTAKSGRSSVDPSLLTLASVVGIVEGRRYLLANATGERELVTVRAVQAATHTVRLASEPEHGYPTGSTLRGLELAATFPALAANDEQSLSARFAIIWTFVGVDVAPMVETIELVRPQAAPYATLADLVAFDSTLSTKQASRLDLSTCIAVATRQYMTDLRLAGIDPTSHYAGEIGTDAIIHLAGYHALKSDQDEVSVRKAEAYLTRYNELRAALSSGKDKPGVSDIDKQSGAEKAPSWRSLWARW